MGMAATLVMWSKLFELIFFLKALETVYEIWLQSAQ